MADITDDLITNAPTAQTWTSSGEANRQVAATATCQSGHAPFFLFLYFFLGQNTKLIVTVTFFCF